MPPGWRQAPQVPKPYRFVGFHPGPIPRSDPRQYGGHERLAPGRLAGVVRGVVVAATHLHVGSGLIVPGSRWGIPLVKSHFSTGGRAALPGSSLKGAVRSVLEAITPSCVRVGERVPEALKGCQRVGSLCLACRLFGSLGYLGQVSFDDAPLLDGQTRLERLPQAFSPRPGPAYVRNGQARGRKFYRHGRQASGDLPVEVIPAGSRLPLTIRLFNVTEAEAGLVLISLGLGPRPFALKLGGMKPFCLGTVRIEIESLELADAKTLYAEFETSRPIGAQVADLVQKAGPLLFDQGLAELADIWQPNSNSCPSGNY